MQRCRHGSTAGRSSGTRRLRLCLSFRSSSGIWRCGGSICYFLLEDLSTHWAFPLAGFRLDPVADAVHVEAMGASADDCNYVSGRRGLGTEHLHTDRTVFAGIFAFGTRPFELHATYATRVVSLFRQIPLPLSDGGVGSVGDLHPLMRRCRWWR
jgi:hypothetical protein